MQSRGAYMALSIITGLLMIVLGGLFLAKPGLSLASVILLVGIFASSMALPGHLGYRRPRRGRRLGESPSAWPGGHQWAS